MFIGDNSFFAMHGIGFQGSMHTTEVQLADLHIAKKGIIHSFNFNNIFLMFFWLCGLIFGCWISFHFSESSISLMRSVAGSKTYIYAYFISLGVPFLITIIATSIHKLFLIYPVAFLKSSCFAICASCTFRSFGSAGWLISRLLLFSDSFGAVALIFFWLILPKIDNNSILKVAGSTLAFLIAIVSIDVLFISPFTYVLLNH